MMYLMSSFRGKGVAEMVMGDVEGKLGKRADEVKVLYITTAGNLHPAEKREKFSKFLRENPDEFYSITEPLICLNDNQLVYVEGESFQIWEGK